MDQHLKVKPAIQKKKTQKNNKLLKSTLELNEIMNSQLATDVKFKSPAKAVINVETGLVHSDKVRDTGVAWLVLTDNLSNCKTIQGDVQVDRVFALGTLIVSGDVRFEDKPVVFNDKGELSDELSDELSLGQCPEDFIDYMMGCTPGESILFIKSATSVFIDGNLSVRKDINSCYLEC